MDNKNLSKKINNLTQEEVWAILSKLPITIQEIIHSEESANINGDIYNKFKLTEDQFQKLLNIFILVYDRQITISQLPELLKNELELPEKEAKSLSLEIAQKRLWVMSDYIGGIEKLIKSLGGEIPKKIQKPTIKQEVINKNIDVQKKNTTTDKISEKNIKMILEENKEIENQLITAQDITLTNSGETRKPSIKYWLSEYIQTLGAGYHPNLDRIGFLYNNPNAKRLPDEERLVLGAVLKSYDDGDSLPFSETTGRLLVEKLKEQV